MKGLKIMLFGIIAMVIVGSSWIGWGYVGGVSAKHNVKMGTVAAMCSLVSALISLPIAISQGFPAAPLKSTLAVAGICLLQGLANYAQLDLMGRAMQKGPNGIIWSMLQSGFIFPFFVGIGFFGEAMSYPRLAAVLLVFLSLGLFAVCSDNSSSGKWKLLALGAFFATGMSNTFCTLPSYFKDIDQISSVWRTMVYFAGMGVGFCIMAIFRPDYVQNFKAALSSKYAWSYVALLDGLGLVSCYGLLYYGIDALAKAGAGAVASPLMISSSIVAFEIYAITVLREKRNVWQVLALLCCLAAVVTFCF